MTGSTLMLVPLAVLIDRPLSLPFPSVSAGLSLAALGILSTALAYILYFRILARAGATNLLLVTFLLPGVAILLGWAVLGETLMARHFAGMAMIALGLAFIDGRILRRRRSGALP